MAKMNPLLKLGLELGPLVVFFAANASRGIFAGTAAFMIATIVALAVSYAIVRTIPVMPLVTGAFVLVFGALTLTLADETFIKLKPTIVNLLFAAILAGGLVTGRMFIKVILESALRLTEQGWVVVTRAWIGFFLTLAALNEVVWRNFPTDTWVNFKAFGIMPLTLIFSFSLIPLILRHTLPDGAEKPPVDRP